GGRALWGADAYSAPIVRTQKPSCVVRTPTVSLMEAPNTSARRVALSTGLDAQRPDHRQPALRVRGRGWPTIPVFGGSATSGATGRDKGPGFDALMKAATRREFDLIALVG